MMIRPTAPAVLLLLGVLATAAAAADAVSDATVKEEGRSLRGVVNKIVSPLTDQLVIRKKPGIKDDPAYDPTRVPGYDPIDPEKYNPTRSPAPKDDPNGRNLRGLINKIVSPLMDQIYQSTTTIDPVTVPGYNPTRPRTDTTTVRIDQFKTGPSPYNPTRPIDPEYNPTRSPAPIDPTKTTSF